MVTADAYIVREGTPPRWAEQLAALQDSVIRPLTRTEEFGVAYGFGAAVEKMQVIREFATALAWQPRKYEKKDLESQVSAHLTTVLQLCDQIRDYDGSGDASTRRQSLLTSLDGEHDWFVGEVGPAIRVAQLVRATTALQDTIAAGEQATAKVAEIDDLVKTVRDVAGNQGAKALAEFFANQAIGHATTAKNFLYGAGAAVIGVVVVAGWVFVLDPIKVDLTSQANWVEFTRQLLPRALAIGVAAYLVRFATRNYTINKHLQVSNEQRANILRTYPALVGQGTNDVQRDRTAVILATAAVSSIDSGYLKQGDDKGLDSSVLAIYEALRNS